MEFGLLDILLRLLLGLVIGFCIGLSGVGGGVLVLPSLTVVLGLPASLAVGTASLCAFLTKTYATYRHFRLKTIDLSTSVMLLLGAIPGNVIVSLLINRHVNIIRENSGTLKAFQEGFEKFIAAVVLVSAVVLTINLISKYRKSTESTETSLVQKLKKYPHIRKAVAVVTGAVIGALIGSTSIGGGVLIIPLLIIFFGLSPSKTVGTSIFVAVVLTLVTSIIYAMGNQMDFHTALFMAGGSLAGVYWGSMLSVRIPEKLLQGILISVIFFAAVLMMVKAY